MTKLKLGVSKIDVTPKIGTCLYGYVPDWHSESINDNLELIAFYFEYEKSKVLFISAPYASINAKLRNELKSLTSDKTSVPVDNIIIAATHTHSAPNVSGSSGWGDVDTEYYETVLKPRFVKVCEEASQNPTEVKMAYTIGESLVGINRREINDKTNKATLGQKPWGPLDKRMIIASFKDNNGDIVANLISYGCHGTAAGRNKEITRDWMGFMTDALEEKTGAVTAFFNGSEGDVGPRLSNGKTTGDITLAKELGEIAASDALRIFENIGEYKEVDLKIVSRTIEFPLLPKIPYETAKLKLEEFGNDEAVNIMKTISDYYKKVIAAYDNNEPDENFEEIPQTALKLGNLVFLTSPFEPFCEICLRIDKMCESYDTMLLSNTEPSRGYFPTEDQLCRGGYEINYFKYKYTQPFVDDADYIYAKESVKTIDMLK